jgi:cellobiose-specific phosphotransferase system component IIB
MLTLNHINLAQNPGLIQPPKVDDNMVIIKLVPDVQEVIASDIIDVALSYSIAGIDVILELPFADRDQFNHQQLASLICNGGWSLSLLAPKTKYNAKYNKTPTVKYAQEYAQHVIAWYQLWRSQTMRNFEKVIYPITPYLEYLTTHYLIDKNKKDLKSKDTQALIALSQNPSDPYLLNLMDTMETSVVDTFKQQLKTFIQKQDKAFYQDIDLLTNQVAKAKCSI